MNDTRRWRSASMHTPTRKMREKSPEPDSPMHGHILFIALILANLGIASGFSLLAIAFD